MRTEKKKERRSKLKRSVEVNDETWEWQVGRSGVVFRSPEGKMSTVSFETFNGYSGEYYDDWPEITPFDVKTWIEEHKEALL
jgi:hypothetical protein